jgi:luciferase family oxidoreductase group 1
MIRNHAPLVAAEHAVLLSQLHPGRIDVGLGRSGGSQPATDARIRRTVVDYDSFEDDVRETVHHLDRLGSDGVQVFVLAASPRTAAFAGCRGLGLAVAGHIAPTEVDAAVAAYRDRFRPARPGAPPHVVICLPVLVAGCDDEARWWFRTVQRRYLDRLRTGGAPIRPPELAEPDWSPSERYRVDAMLAGALVGSAATVHDALAELSRRLSPDEVMAVTDLTDPAVTLASHTELARIVAALGP